MSETTRDLIVVRIDPMKINYYWPLFEYGLRYSSPPGCAPTEEYISNILAGALGNKLQCWLAYRKKDGKFWPLGTVITRVDRSTIRGTNNLIIENLYGFGGVPGDIWRIGMNTLLEFAKGQGCKSVIGYSHNSRVVEISQAGLACDNIYSVLEWRVE